MGPVKQDHIGCVSCQLSKHHALPFSNSDSVSSTPFDLIYYDIWGPALHVTIGVSCYIVISVEDYSRFTWIYLMQNRFELPSIYFQFANMITTQFSSKIKILRTDNTMEYKESSLTQILSQNRTIVQKSCSGTSHQNGHVEGKDRYILDMVKAFLISFSCPEIF